MSSELKQELMLVGKIIGTYEYLFPTETPPETSIHMFFNFEPSEEYREHLPPATRLVVDWRSGVLKGLKRVIGDMDVIYEVEFLEIIKKENHDK